MFESGYPPSVNRRELDVAKAEADEILRLATDLDYPEQPPPETGCADCFVYSLSSPAGELSHDDVSLPEAPAAEQEVVHRLGAIVDAELFPGG